jgi:hypothetical protein
MFNSPGRFCVQQPVPWEEIERMSLCSPLWGDDKDSDISDPDSQDRVTIYTTDLSPTASELAIMHQARSRTSSTGQQSAIMFYFVLLYLLV